MSNPFDDLFSEESAAQSETVFSPSQIRHDKAARAASFMDLDVDLAIEGLDLETGITQPLQVTFHPITGESVNLTDIESVVRNILDVKAIISNVEKFEADLRRSALNLAAGETKTRRLSAVVDGELRTLMVELPDDYWPNRDLAIFYGWCDKNKESLGSFGDRFVRKAVKTEYSPIKKEVKKLLNETLPEGTLLAEAKEKLLACNKGNSGKLPKVTVEGEKLAARDAQSYGEGDE